MSSPLDESPVFTDKTPKTTKQLEELRERYRRFYRQELPKSVELAMHAEDKQ